ncbi:PREDICTED: uncharacterized protein LOC106807495 [Priapulus caudatus]|uniref:Uncharacterized protein LOC106807495 n=1 Tax=Priapulus caudatus TaxID=37621 RepID=A0ABM1DZE7_PRICU|nr:PREDICTED: uncharacterized protein LOC106807495 [Priapulus caudatus]
MQKSSKFTKNMHQRHPIVDSLYKDGITCTNTLRIAENVYIDLCEVKGWRRVTWHVLNRKIVVFSGQVRAGNAPQQIVVPVSSDTLTSFKDLDVMLHDCSHLLGETNSCITMAIVAPDSLVVYYDVSAGIVPPPLPVAAATAMPKRREKLRSRPPQKRTHAGDDPFHDEIQLPLLGLSAADESTGNGAQSEQCADVAGRSASHADDNKRLEVTGDERPRLPGKAARLDERMEEGRREGAAGAPSRDREDKLVAIQGWGTDTWG